MSTKEHMRRPEMRVSGFGGASEAAQDDESGLACGHAYPDGSYCNRPKTTCQGHTEPGAADGPHVVRTVDRSEGHEVVTFTPTSAAAQKTFGEMSAALGDLPTGILATAEPTRYPTPALDRLQSFEVTIPPETGQVLWKDGVLASAVQSDIADAVKPWKDRAEQLEEQRNEWTGRATDMASKNAELQAEVERLKRLRDDAIADEARRVRGVAPPTPAFVPSAETMWAIGEAAQTDIDVNSSVGSRYLLCALKMVFSDYLLAAQAAGRKG